MKKYALLTAGLLLAAGSALAASNNGVAFGVVNIQDILQKSPQVAKMRQTLQKQFASRQDKLLKASKALKADMEKLHRDGAVMSKTDRDALEKQILNGRNDFQKMQAQLQKDFYAAQDKAMHAILNKVTANIAKTAANQHLQFVLPKSGVAYIQPGTLDITETVRAAVKN